MIQELEKDKWLCTLSQKKFKAPEFVRKHILNKFGENVEEVKMDVEFFNNYIRDDKRPSMPMAPPSLTNRGQEEPRQMKRPIEMTTGRREFQVHIFSIYVFSMRTKDLNLLGPAASKEKHQGEVGERRSTRHPRCQRSSSHRGLQRR